jgi:hypothetical protein
MAGPTGDSSGPGRQGTTASGSGIIGENYLADWGGALDGSERQTGWTVGPTRCASGTEAQK